MKIAIDGPGGAGKSTVARLLARKLGMTYIDTGAMYRAVALAVISRGICADDADAVKGALGDIEVGVAHDPSTGEQRVFLNGGDATALIRTPQISAGASDVSRIPEVRLRMVEIQRAMAVDRDVVMDGRDIGTFVFPDAEKKYYLTASAETRAGRRYLELCERGVDATYEKCLADLRQRDENDSTRAFAPLAVAEGAVLVDTEGLTAEEVAVRLLSDIAGAPAGLQDGCANPGSACAAGDPAAGDRFAP